MYKIFVVQFNSVLIISLVKMKPPNIYAQCNREIATLRDFPRSLIGSSIKDIVYE